jgi:hypothetical protein
MQHFLVQQMSMFLLLTKSTRTTGSTIKKHSQELLDWVTILQFGLCLTTSNTMFNLLSQMIGLHGGKIVHQHHQQEIQFIKFILAGTVPLLHTQEQLQLLYHK